MQIKRDGVTVFSVNIGPSTVFTHQLMGEHKISAEWISSQPIEITLGDYIELGAEKFYLNLLPQVEKLNNFTYKYTATFEGEIYKLFNKLFQDEGAAEFTYFGDVIDYLDLIVSNLNSVETGWTFIAPENVTPVSINFSGDSCRQALTKICEAFELEFRLVQKEIILAENVGFNSTYQFEYGRGKGLYSLVRNSVVEKGVITRLYGYGGSRNLSFDYRSGSKRLVFEVGDPAKRYVEANVNLFGIRESSVVFENIYPNRTGEVSALVPGSIFKVIDSSLDFNINDYLLEGQEAKIVFKTGALAGYEFPITAYDHATKQITFGEFVDSNDYKLPNSLNFAEIGDLYTLVNIKMPEAYIEAAEGQLLEATQDYLDKVKSPRAIYTLNIDERFIRANGVELTCGMKIGIRDEALGLEDSIRIFAISFPLVNPKQIVAEIADNIPVTSVERIRKDSVKTKNEISTIDRTREENYRDSVRKWRQLQEKIFDPDGYFDPTNIRPGSIETLQLTVGANSQNFGLNLVEIEANFEGDPNRIRISGGQLIHFEIEIPDLGYVWTMDQRIQNDLVSGDFYYVYARCNKAALSGSWVISTAPIKSEEETGFYHFWLGVLYPEESGRRYFMFTKGMTFIVGDSITTGVIKDLSGLNFFDLSQGKFSVGDEINGLDWGVTEPGKLTIRGAIITNAIFANDGVIENLRVSSLKTANSGKRLEILADDGGDPATPLHNLKFYDVDGNLALTLDTAVDAGNSSTASAGFKIEKHGSSRKALMTQNGIMSSGSFLTDSDLPTNQHLGSLLGILKEKFFSAFGIRAGVIGFDATDPATGNPSYGGWFNTFFGGGMNIGVRQITANYTATLDDTLISCYNSSPIEINLPANPRPGKWILVRTNFNVVTQINGNGNTIWVKGGVSSIAVSGSSYSRHGRMHMLIWDGTYWLYNAIPAVGTD